MLCNRSHTYGGSVLNFETGIHVENSISVNGWFTVRLFVILSSAVDPLPGGAIGGSANIPPAVGDVRPVPGVQWRGEQTRKSTCGLC